MAQNMVAIAGNGVEGARFYGRSGGRRGYAASWRAGTRCAGPRCLKETAMPISKPFLQTAAALTLALSLAPGGARAADTPDANDKLGPVREQIQQKKWAAAVDLLKSVNDTGSADWNNLMGYSLRHIGTPEHAAAETHYDAALRIDPKHRGALEYSGELYLITGNLPKAEERLATLDKVCRLPCAEYTDLKKAVARYKANGKYVAGN